MSEQSCGATIVVRYAATSSALTCDGAHDPDGRHHAWWSALSGTEVMWTAFVAEVDALHDRVWEYR